MADIVDRLKAYAEINEQFGTYTEAKAARDAAEEIERLRQRLRQIIDDIAADIDNTNQKKNK